MRITSYARFYNTKPRIDPYENPQNLTFQSAKPICVFYGSVSEIVTQHFPGERRVLRAISAISSTHTASMSMRLEYV